MRSQRPLREVPTAAQGLPVASVGHRDDMWCQQWRRLKVSQPERQGERLGAFSMEPGEAVDISGDVNVPSSHSSGKTGQGREISKKFLPLLKSQSYTSGDRLVPQTKFLTREKYDGMAALVYLYYIFT